MRPSTATTEPPISPAQDAVAFAAGREDGAAYTDEQAYGQATS